MLPCAHFKIAAPLESKKGLLPLRGNLGTKLLTRIML